MFYLMPCPVYRLANFAGFVAKWKTPRPHTSLFLHLSFNVHGMLTPHGCISRCHKRSYSRVWHLLHNFCVEINRPQQSQAPVSPSIVFLFQTKQVGRGVAGRSLLTYCSAISFVHRLRNLPDPTTKLAI